MIICMFLELMHSINLFVASLVVKKICIVSCTLIIVLLRTINIVNTYTGFGINA